MPDDMIIDTASIILGSRSLTGSMSATDVMLAPAGPLLGVPSSNDLLGLSLGRASTGGGVLTEVPVGVFILLADCYSPTCSMEELCYSVSCPRRLYQLQNQANKYKIGDFWSSSCELLEDATSPANQVKEEDLWWSNTVPKEVQESVSKEEEKRQNAIYDIIKTEKNYVEELKIIQSLYAGPLREANVIETSRLETFAKVVFCNAADLLNVNSRILGKLLARQKETYIVEKIGDIFLSCASELSVYIEYCGNREYSRNDIALEKAQNPKFKEFLANAHVGSGIRAEIKHELDGYLHKPIARMASYLLLLRAILEKTPADHSDKVLIPQAIKAIEEVLGKMNAASGKTMTKIKLMQLNQQIYMGDFDLQLMDPERQIIYEGKLVLKRPTGDLSLFVFLFDHYLIMTRKIVDKKVDMSKLKSTRFKIYKRPIKYELIAPNPPPEAKLRPMGMSRTQTNHIRPSSTVFNGKGLSPKTTVQTVQSVATASTAVSGSPLSAQPPVLSPQLQASSTISSVSSSAAATSPTTPQALGAASLAGTPGVVNVENKLQFSITVVGRETGGVYLFQVDTESGRNIWREHIMKLRSKRLLGNVVFDMGQRLVDTWSVGAATSTIEKGTVVIHVNPQEAVGVNSTKFTCCCDVGGRLVIATEVGLFVGPRGSVLEPEQFSDKFVQVLELEKITQVDVVLEHGLLLVLADKTMYSYNTALLETRNEETRKAKKIGDAINFFKVGFANNRTLVCTVRTAQLSSTIKIFESVEFSTMKRKGRINLFSREKEAMKLFKEFYIPTEASSIHILKTKLVVGCTKGFEIVDLETLETQALLDPSDDSLDFVLVREDTKPMAIFKTGEDEYLLCYDDFGFFVDRTGRRARPDFILKWAGNPTSFAHISPYILAFDPSFVCVRDLNSGDIAQVVYATGIKTMHVDAERKFVLGVTTGTNGDEKQSLFRLKLIDGGLREEDEDEVIAVKSQPDTDAAIVL
ncbi:UNVERIFIED_CONTAM: RHO1 GDP-GTP exchange protein 2 [Siphonaria sp. JEL0065]|nr:RHO1 GDP-GTP exchange protein 2 [Siphonaria sp. JEL0065]